MNFIYISINKQRGNFKVENTNITVFITMNSCKRQTYDVSLYVFYFQKYYFHWNPSKSKQLLQTNNWKLMVMYQLYTRFSFLRKTKAMYSSKCKKPILLFCIWTNSLYEWKTKIERNGQNRCFLPLFSRFWTVFDVFPTFLRLRKGRGKSSLFFPRS